MVNQASNKTSVQSKIDQGSRDEDVRIFPESKSDFAQRIDVTVQKEICICICFCICVCIFIRILCDEDEDDSWSRVQISLRRKKRREERACGS